MRTVLTTALCVGLATVAGAQLKTDNPGSPVQPMADMKGDVTTLPVISKTTNGSRTELVLDISGEQSWDYLHDDSNTILMVPLPPGNLMTGIGYDVGITTVGGSYLSEARFYFDGSDQDDYGLFLTPGYTDSFPGTGWYSSGGIIDLTDNGIPDIPIQADGFLWIQLYEGYDDVADAVDADYLNPSTLTIVYEEPPAPRCPIWFEDFDGGTWPPAGWSSLDNTGNGDWNTNTFYGRGNYCIGGIGECAMIDSDGIGSVDLDCELYMPAIDLPAYGVTLEFDMDYQNWAYVDFADVDISTDGGGSWTNLVSYNSDLTQHSVIDLSAYAGMTVNIRYHYYLANYAWWWQIDNVGLYPIAGATSRNEGSNPDVYTVPGLPVMGGTFTGEVDCSVTGHAMALLVGFDDPWSYTLPGGQVVLVDVSGPELLMEAWTPGPLASFSHDMPPDCSYAGYEASTQALMIGGGLPFALTNAQDIALGY